ncbi:hypothetical protein BDR26DRAFT_851044 [Obelidium mucronatum]|nr:hypothetical protein BDR26DRAFT_851044 [Obelidium mucronatum]
MEVSVIDTVLRSDSSSSYCEGSVRISLPLLMHAQSRINREELKPLSLEAVVVGKSGDAFFYSSEPLVLWRSTAINNTGLNTLNLNGGGSSNRRENVWSFCSDVSTGNEDHTLDDDFNENDRIFDTALKQGASFMQFPFRFKLSSDLPPSMTASASSSNTLDSSCPHCADQLQQGETSRPGLVRFPQYEVMAMLSFESFAVSAYQVVSASIPLVKGLRSDIAKDEVLKGDGVLGGGAFRYKIWDAPKYYLLGSSIPYDFKLQLIAGTIELSKIDTITVRPVFRYRHMSAPEIPTLQHSHLYTPYQNTQPQPSRTLFLPQPAPGTPPAPAQTLQITLPPLTSIPYPTASNLGSWALENSLEIAVTYRTPQSGSLGRMMKPVHAHHLHHVDGGYVQLSDGLRMGFMNIPITVVQPALELGGPPPLVPDYHEDEEERRMDMEKLMDRVEQMGVLVGGTVSCLFSAKKLVRIGLKDWVAAGTDEEMSMTNRTKKGGDQDEDGYGAVAMYRSDAKVKPQPAAPKPVVAPPPVQPVAPPSPVAAGVISPVIPQRTVSAVTVAAELGNLSPTVVSPSIPKRLDSTDVATILDTERRQSIVQSLNLTEIPSPQYAPIIPKRGNSQQPKRIFVQPQFTKALLPLSRGFGIGASLDRRPVPTRNNAPLPPLPAGQLPPPQQIRQPYGGLRSVNPSVNTASDISNNQWGSGIPGSSLNRPPPPSRPTVPIPTSSLATQQEYNDDEIPVSSLSYEQDDEFFASAGQQQHDNDEQKLNEVHVSVAKASYYTPEPIDESQFEVEQDPTTPTTKKQVTFNDDIEAFSAKSIAFTASTTSAISQGESDFDADEYQFELPTPKNKNRMSIMTPTTTTTPTTPSPTMTAMEAEEFAKRLSLGTQVEEEVLLLSGDEETGVDVYGEYSENQSMVPGGRGVLESPPNTWEEGGVVVGIVDEYGRPLRTASLPRRTPANGVEPFVSASLPRGVGAGVPRGPLDDSNTTWSKAGGFLTRMVGSLGRSPIPAAPRSSSQERIPGPSGSNLMTPGAATGAPGTSPYYNQKSPVVITPRTSSARWTEDDRRA